MTGNNGSGVSPFRAELIRTTERKIDALRTRTTEMESELEAAWAELEDARSTLVLLKTGKEGPAPAPERHVRNVKEMRDWIRARGSSEFTSTEFRRAFGFAASGGEKRTLNRFEEEGLIVTTYPGGRGDPKPKTFRVAQSAPVPA